LRTEIEANLAANFFEHGRLMEALQLLDSSEIAQQARSERTQYLYYVLLAQVLQGLERYADAQRAVLQALSIAEGTRGKLRLYDDRISWHASQEVVYRMGVRIALANNDRWTSFDLVERSRARAFVDQLAAGHLPLPPTAQHLQEIEETLLTKREVLFRLTDTVKVFGPAFIDYELVRQLATLDTEADVFEQADDGARFLSVPKLTHQLDEIEDSLLRLRRQIEDAHLASSVATSVPTLSVDELRQMLMV